MAARTNKQAVRGNAGRSLNFPWWAWLLAGLLSGIALSALVIFKDSQRYPTPQPTTVKNDADKSIAELASDADAKKKKPQYDFYQVLPEMEVVIPDAEISEKATRPDLDVSAGQRYFLQMGSFPNAADADAMKARLALIGVQASITEVTINNVAWHRVRSGPYANVGSLEAAKRDLTQNNIESIILKENAR
jgi:cell division protein FtsN